MWDFYWLILANLHWIKIQFYVLYLICVVTFAIYFCKNLHDGVVQENYWAG